MDHLFEDIEVKENALELLDASLKKKRKPCMIGMGAMTDPYIPLEDQLLYTRGALEIIDRNGFGVTLITKSSRVLRDLDVFDYSLVIAPVVADLCTTPVALSAPPNSYQNNSQS